MVTEVAPSLQRRNGEPVYDCQGGAVLPGLCDHHVHLHAMAARAGSARCGPPDVTGPASLADALAAAVPDRSGWIRGTGYTESVAGDLDAPALDKLRADRPVRIQHRSGALWILNTIALAAIGAIAPGPSRPRPRASHPGERGFPQSPAPIPPSTASSEPVQYRLSSEAKKTAAPVMSSGVPRRPIGVLSISAFLTGGSFRSRSVIADST